MNKDKNTVQPIAGLDAVKMMRDIREKLSDRYWKNPDMLNYPRSFDQCSANCGSFGLSNLRVCMIGLKRTESLFSVKLSVNYIDNQQFNCLCNC